LIIERDIDKNAILFNMSGLSPTGPVVYPDRSNTLSMRILFSSGPGVGHILPSLPLARALRERGDEVALLTADVMSSVVAGEDIDVLPAGPGPDVLVAEIARRTGADLFAGPPTREVEAELFAGTRVDLSIEQALEAAAAFRPDLIVCEHYDFVGPLVGAVLQIPVATLAYGPAMAADLAAAMAEVVAKRYAAHGVTRQASRWYLDTCPDALQLDGWQAPAGRIGLRPQAHRAAGRAAATPPSAGRQRPQILVSFGTVFAVPQMLAPLLRQLTAADLDLRVTTGLFATAADFGIESERVEFAGFTPLDELIQDVDLVLTHGGAGTTLGSLASGIPLVVVPQGADQFVQADRVTAAGVGLTVTGEATESVAPTVLKVLADPSFRANAGKVAAQIAALPSPADVAEQLAAALEK
jgi:UDP:flavonoid glycosyltransferase YjiC (YdhE family)